MGSHILQAAMKRWHFLNHQGFDLQRCCLAIFLCLSGVTYGMTRFEPQCNPDEWFKCNDGLCVTKRWRCDGEPDCVDGSDEVGCDNAEPVSPFFDPVDQPVGRSGNLTLSLLFKPCDNASEFQCKTNYLCVPNYWLCDGVNDCTDKSDEDPEMCRTRDLSDYCGNDKEMFFCNDADKKCIPKRWVCDGNNDCPNMFDENERTCPNVTRETSTCDDGFLCSKQGDVETCLAWNFVCNNKKDCPNGDDEGIECVTSCAKIDCKGENERCRGNPKGEGTCVCDQGFRLDSNGTCSDVDECNSLQVPPCSQKCINERGKFYCDCEFGYDLDDNGDCRASHRFADPAVLYFSGNTEIRSREVTSEHYRLITADEKQVKQAIGVAFDPTESRIYWADVKHKFIASTNLDGLDFQTWEHEMIEKPEFLAIDYLGRNFYYSDSVKKIIGVCTLKGLFCQAVITTGITNPRGIAIQPDHGLLAYTNWDDDIDNHPHIGLAGMDGRELVILANDSIRWPNGLAFDMPSDRLFWGEAYYDVLESIRLDGTGRVSVKPATNLMSLHPFSIAVFEDTIYWSDYGLRDIQSCHKFTGQNHKVVVKSARIQTYGIQIAHQYLQPPYWSPCNHERCSHMCLISKGAKDSVCRCAKDFTLVNGHKCVKEDLQVPIFSPLPPANVTESTSTTEVPKISSGFRTLPPITVTSTESSTSMNETTSTINTEEVTKCLHCTTITTEASTFHPNLTVVPSPVIEENNSAGVTIGVIMAVLAFIGCIIFVAFVWRRRFGRAHKGSEDDLVRLVNDSVEIGRN